MFQAVIFDFDGVLFDSELIHFAALNSVLTKYAIKISVEEYFEKYVGLFDQAMIALIQQEYGFSINAQHLILEKHSAYQKIISTMPVLNAKKNMLTILAFIAKQNLKRAICSNAKRVEIASVLPRLEQGKIQAYFKTIISSDDVREGKPSPEGYLLASKEIATQPGQCLIVEDSITGVRAAKAAGMYTVGLIGTLTQDKLTEADTCIQDIIELQSILTGN